MLRAPALVRVDRPPRRLPAATAALFADGLWRGQVKRQFPETPGVLYRLPIVLVLAVVVSFVLGAAGIFGLVAGTVGASAVITTILSYFLLIPLAYIVVVVSLAVIVGAHEGWRVGFRFVTVLPAIHFSWGVGFLFGYIRLDPPVREPLED